MPFKFGVDSSGHYGYIKDGADTVTPFRTGNATTAQVLSGYTFANATYPDLTGAMPNIKAIDDAIASNYVTNGSSGSGIYARMNTGAHITKASSGYPELFIPQSQIAGMFSATATAADITSGKTAWVTGVKITGTKGAPSNKYVYYRGDLCYSITGGWRHPMHSSYYSVGFTTDHIYLYDGCSTFPVHTITENKVNVSNYSYINLVVKIITDDDSDRAFKVQLCSATSYDSDGITASKTYTYSTNHTSETNVTIKHNISSLSGSYYVRLYAVLCNVRVYEIYFS